MPGYTVGLVVVDDVVVRWPPIAARWAAGRDARTVWREASRRGAELVWLPDQQEVTAMQSRR